MERSQHHFIFLLLVGAALLPAAADCTTVAESCDTKLLAGQVYDFCQPGEESTHDHDTACCKAARSSVEMSLSVPFCICRLEEEPAFLVTGLSIRDLVRTYIACGGRNNTVVWGLVDDRDRCSAPPPQQQHGPVHAEDIYADQPTPQ